MATPTSFLDLPLDVLFVIFPYLDAHDFLNLTSTCKDLHDSTIRDHSAYWGYATRSKFRVRNRLAVQQDGFHWRRLYRRLLTQSRVFTWGQNTWGCLGQDAHETRVAPPRHPQPQFRLGPGDRRRGFGRGGLAQVCVCIPIVIRAWNLNTERIATRESICEKGADRLDFRIALLDSQNLCLYY